MTAFQIVYMELGMKTGARLIYHLLVVDDQRGVTPMADYAKMYHRLFDSQTRAIAILQQGQIESEEMYIKTPEPEIRLLDPSKQDGGKE